MADATMNKLARDFARFGWLGFWLQAILAVIPIFVLCYLIFGKATGTRLSFGFGDYLAFVGIAILAFTTIWSYRYVRLAKRIADPQRRPLRERVTGVLWIGVWASCLGIVVSLLLLFIDIFRLLFLLMKAPQGGVPVFQTQADNRSAWVSAIDAVGLLAEACTLTGELLILSFTLWLLFRVTQFGSDFNSAATSAA